MTAAADTIVDRIAAIDWAGVNASLDEQGSATLQAVLAPDECETLIALYADDARFRTRIDMSRYRFGAGEYKYFAAPLPAVVQSLRQALYARLAPIANRWSARLRKSEIRNLSLNFLLRSIPSSRSVMRRVRAGRHRCSCPTRRAATTACIRTSTAPSPFRSRRFSR